jgi:hypothetical protein
MLLFWIRICTPVIVLYKHTTSQVLWSWALRMCVLTTLLKTLRLPEVQQAPYVPNSLAYWGHDASWRILSPNRNLCGSSTACLWNCLSKLKQMRNDSQELAANRFYITSSWNQAFCELCTPSAGNRRKVLNSKSLNATRATYYWVYWINSSTFHGFLHQLILILMKVIKDVHNICAIRTTLSFIEILHYYYYNTWKVEKIAGTPNLETALPK